MIYPAPFVFGCVKRFVSDLRVVTGGDCQQYSPQVVQILNTVSDQCDSIADIIGAAERLMTGEYSDASFLKAVSDVLDSVPVRMAP